MNRRKTVAVIGPDFPPCSRPSSLRVRSFVSHLDEHGWRPIVLTTEARHYREGALDYDIERSLPESLEVIRTGALPAGVARRIGLGDIGMRSFWHHWRVLSRLCRRREVDLTFISVPPSVPMLLGRLAWQRFGVPYVIDYQDPWRTEMYWRLPRAQRPPKWPVAYWMARLLEPLAVRRAAHVVAVSEATNRTVLANYPELKGLASTEIPFGVEPADFEHLRTDPRENPVFDPGDGRLHVTYTGAFIQPMENALRGVFRALRLGLDREPGFFGRVRLHFVGTNYSGTAAGPGPVTRIAEEMGVAASVDERTARVSYLDSLQILLDSDCLLLLGSSEAHYSPSKAFAYLASRRPALALCREDSNVVPALRGSPDVSLVTMRPGASVDAEEVVTALRRTLTTEDRPTAIPGPVAGWTASAMTGRLARVFDQVTAGAAA